MVAQISGWVPATPGFMPETDVEQRVVPLLTPPGTVLTPIDLNRPLCGTRMKGFALLHLLDSMGASRSEPMVADWCATVPEAQRRLTERTAITSVSWIPVEYYFHAVAFAAQKRFGEGPRHALRIGHEMASADISAFFRFVLSMASPSTVLGLSGRFWKSYFDVSSLTVLSSTPTSVVAEVKDWPLRDEVSLHEMAGSLVAWMEASRARDVKMSRFELVAPGHFLLHANWS